jgi:hypothetical protein
MPNFAPSDFDIENMQNALNAIAEASAAKAFFEKKIQQKEDNDSLAQQICDAGVKASDLQDPSTLKKIQVAMVIEATMPKLDSDFIPRLFEKNRDESDEFTIKNSIKQSLAALQPSLTDGHQDFLAHVLMKECDEPGFIKEFVSLIKERNAEKDPARQQVLDDQLKTLYNGGPIEPNSKIAKDLVLATAKAELDELELEDLTVELEDEAELENKREAEEEEEIENAQYEAEETPANPIDPADVAIELVADLAQDTTEIEQSLSDNNVKTHESPRPTPPGTPR